MRNLIVLVSLILGKTWAQNLVPNPSFESFTNCPESGSEIYYATPWIGLTNNSVDYFNSCSIQYSVPNNGTFQYAKTGNAYSAIWIYNGIGLDYREYLRTELTSTLIQDNCYLVSFFCNLHNYVKYATNNIALNLNVNQINSTGNALILDLNPDITILNNRIIDDTLNWVEIKGIFNASGGEKYLTIGNFKYDSETDTVNTGNGTYPGAYYYIDDISVIAISDLPNNMPANAGPDINLTLGDSVFIGQEISNLNCTWSVLGGSQIADSISGIWVSPTVTTSYVVEQNLCGTVTNDTLTVFVHGVGLTSIKEEKSFLVISPNPNSGDFEIDLSMLKGEKVSIQILDASGRLVFEKESEIESKFNIETNLNKGVYFLRLSNQTGVFGEKIVIQ